MRANAKDLGNDKLLAGGIGGGLALYDGITQARNGNWTGAAYTAGSIVGGVAGGSLVGGSAGGAINPNVTRGFWSPSRDVANRFRPSLGSISKWLGTGPDAAAATGASGLTGASVAIPAKGGC